MQNPLRFLYISWITEDFANQFVRLIPDAMSRKYDTYYLTIPITRVLSENCEPYHDVASQINPFMGKWINVRSVRRWFLKQSIVRIKPTLVWQTAMMFPEEVALFHTIPRIFEFTDYPLWPLDMNRYINDNVRTAEYVFACSTFIRDKIKSLTVDTQPPIKTISPGYNYSTLLTFKPLSKRKKRRVCYAGSINSRIDFELVRKVILDNPLVKFVFCGKEDFYNTYSSHNDDRLRWVPLWNYIKALPNVSFTGSISKQNLYQIISESTIGWIPYQMHEFNTYSIPIKVLEYLYLGANVISSPIMYVSDLAKRFDHIRVYRTQDQCGHYINFMLNASPLRFTQSQQTAILNMVRATNIETKIQQITEVLQNII